MFKGQDAALDNYYKVNIEHHLAISTDQILVLQDENKDLKKQVMDQKKQVMDLKSEFLILKNQSMVLMRKEDQSRYSFTWKIDDFTKQLQDAKQEDRDITLSSDPFYTHVGGYRIKLRLYPNGYCIGKGTHLSVYMAIMKGKFDAVLTWPFNWEYTFTLLDQKPDQTKRKDVVYSLTPDISKSSYQRPTKDENKAIGNPKFVSHEILQSENYVVDGVLFIKFEVEIPSP